MAELGVVLRSQLKIPAGVNSARPQLASAGNINCSVPPGRAGTPHQTTRTGPFLAPARQNVSDQRKLQVTNNKIWKIPSRAGRRSRGAIPSSGLSEARAAGKYYVLQPDSKKATGYYPPFSKALLDSLLLEMPKHLLEELRAQVQNRVKSRPTSPAENAAEDELLFEQVVKLMGDYNRNLLYQLPGESLEEVQSFLSERGRVLYIADSKIRGAGRGGFAKVPIKAGTLITQYISENQLLNAPGVDSRPMSSKSVSAATASEASPAPELEPEASSSGKEEGDLWKYDYNGVEDDWPPYAIPHLLNDHSCLRGADLYEDPSLKMAQYLRRVATLNNVAFIERWGERFAIATRDIEEGEELLWSYGISWWLDVERENMFMVLLWVASEEKESTLGSNARELIGQAWLKIRLLEEAAQAGKAMELEVVGKYGPKPREEVYVMQPLPAEFEDPVLLREQLVPYYADMLENWKRDTFDQETMDEMRTAMFGR